MRFVNKRPENSEPFTLEEIENHWGYKIEEAEILGPIEIDALFFFVEEWDGIIRLYRQDCNEHGVAEGEVYQCSDQEFTADDIPTAA